MIKRIEKIVLIVIPPLAFVFEHANRIIQIIREIDFEQPAGFAGAVCDLLHLYTSPCPK